MSRIVLIDDDSSLREVVGFMLAGAGHEVLPAADGAAGLELLEGEPDLVVSDIRMPGLDGMEVLRRVRETPSPPPVIMLTAHGTVEQAVQAMRQGAFTYLLKPFSRDELLLSVEQALHAGRLERDNDALRRLLRRRQADCGMLYRSQAMEQFMRALRQAAPSDATVLLQGESGTGKELAARALHDLSARWDKPFVAVNCGAIPGELVESELFGHARGAFTGAEQARPGRLRAADGGTLLLDEVAELPLSVQPKLLRALEARQVDPVGGPGPVAVDFRLVCATHRDLAQEVAAGRFREDLWYRLNVVPLALPPLRERAADIPLLWEHFTLLHGGPGVSSEPALVAALAQLPWRGNVRELRNINQRLVLMRGGDTLTLASLRELAPHAGGVAPAAASGAPDDAQGLPLGPLPPGGMSLVELEKEVIRRALALCGGNRSRTAAYLGIPRHVLLYRLAKFELE